MLLGRAATGPGRRGGGVSRTGQVEQVGALGLVELQCPGQRFQYAVGDAVQVSPLQSGVVVDTDPGEKRYFLPAKSGNAPVAAVRGQSRLLRRDLGPAGGQEVADLGSAVHASDVTCAGAL